VCDCNVCAIKIHCTYNLPVEIVFFFFSLKHNSDASDIAYMCKFSDSLFFRDYVITFGTVLTLQNCNVLYTKPAVYCVPESAVHLAGQELTRVNVREQVKISTFDSKLNPWDELLVQSLYSVSMFCITDERFSFKYQCDSSQHDLQSISISHV